MTYSEADDNGESTEAHGGSALFTVFIAFMIAVIIIGLAFICIDVSEIMSIIH